MINYCSEIDDFRPIQSTLLTRFSSKDSSDFWRTTNQDYGAFYYRQTSRYNCIPDNLKSKLYQRHNRFQDWLTYQSKYQNLSSSINRNSNNQTIFPSDRNETVRITHRKRFLSDCQDSSNLRHHFSPCGESGLITEYIVKKIIDRLQYLIKQDEYPDVIECTQILVSEILAEQPSISVNEIIDRVIEIMSTPPKIDPPILPNPCPPSQVPLNNCQSNVFEKLCQLENAISKLSKS